MTFYTQTAPGGPDDVEGTWHGGPREQGGYATARPADGSMEDMHDALGRYEHVVKAAAEGVSKSEPGTPIKSYQGTVRHDLQGLRAITVAGVQLMVDSAVFDDFELLESLAEIQRGDILALPTVFRAVAGDQAQELLDAIRGENGRVTATAATETLVQIMSELAPKA